MRVDSIRPKTVRPSPHKEDGLTWLQGLQIVFGVVVSLTTAVISWQTYRLSQETQQATSRLKEIEQQLAESRFSFERTREVYDRTEKYLTAEKQHESRGRVLIALISSMPDSSLRTDLLAVVTEKAQLSTIAARAARAATASRPAPPIATTPAEPPPSKPTTLPKPSFSGVLQLAFNADKYTVTTMGDFSFTDSKGRKWGVPKGTTSTGSAVPRAMWSLIGGPFDSKTVFASILLEYHSGLRSAPPDQVHAMFYEALLAQDVPLATAKILFNAVSSFGPRWEVNVDAQSK